jgi:hypothetical protein
MSEQSFQSHAHHPKAAYVTYVFAIVAIVFLIGQMFFGWQTANWAMLALWGAVATLGGIIRWYIVALQDRIIMLEMKVRAAEVLPPGQDAQLSKLTVKQIVALRFASDDELGSLLDRAVRENLTPRDIKASIRTWRPDPYRT